jgi:hypothetical protein
VNFKALVHKLTGEDVSHSEVVDGPNDKLVVQLSKLSGEDVLWS